jgi:hypothetical protein
VNIPSEAGTVTDDSGPGLAASDVQGDLEPGTSSTQADPGPFRDIPQSIWVIFLAAWALLFLLFVLFFAVTPAAAFVVTIAGLFALIAFGLPIVMSGLAKCDRHDCGGIIHTRTGPLSVAAAGTQIVLIPVAAVIGVSAFIAFAM